MKRQTRIEEVRSIAKALLYIDIAPTRLSYIASHPFTNTWGTALPREKGGKTLIEFVDLREAEGQRQWREALESRIEEASLFAILSMLNKPYILTFLKYAKGAISNEDLGECLHRSWKLIENISTDVNVSGRELVSMFKRAAKETLMEESEVAFLNRLPDTVTVYRGVTKVNVYRGVTKVNQTRQGRKPYRGQLTMKPPYGLPIGIGTMRQRAAYMRYGLLPFRKIEFLLPLPRTERITRGK